MRDLREGTAGNLRIMATPPLGHSIIPPALQNFLLARPEVLVQYDVRRMENVIKELETGSAELGLVLGVGSHPAVNVRTLHSELMVALVHPAHPLASSVQVTPEDCLIHGHIGLDHLSRLGVLLRLAFEERGVPYLSYAAPPISSCSISKFTEERSSMQLAILSTSFITSGPIPSPGNTNNL